MKKGLILVLLLVSISTIKAQNAKLDSLRQILPDLKGKEKAEVLKTLMMTFNKKVPDSTLYYSRLLATHGNKIGEQIYVNKAYDIAGGEYYRKDMLDSAAYYFQKAYDVAIANGYENTASRNLANLATVNFRRADYEGALKSFIARLKIVENDVAQKASLGMILNNISMVYMRLDADSLAIPYSKRSLEVKKELKDSLGVLNSLNTLGAVYAEADMLDSSFYYSKRAVQLGEKLQNDRSIVTACINIGFFFMSEKYNNLDSAIYYSQKGLVISQKNGLDSKTASLKNNLSRIYIDRKDYNMALEMAMSALPIYEALDEKRRIAEAKNNIAYSLSKLGRYREAFRYQKELQTLRDSIFNEDKANAVTTIQVEYETDKKNQQIALQESELETNAALLSKQTLARNIAIGGALFLALIAYLIYWIKSRSNKEISAKNDQLGKALGERESLLKEIHHRVKNNLQVIASLLYLQSDKTDDVSVKKLLEEGQGRVRSMALIHQKLYENEDLKHIPFEDYLSELVGEIKKTFGAAADGIDLQIEAKDIQFDVDTAVPLGLIINELSTNAFKYAFAERLGGAVLSIKLEQNDGEYHMTVADNGSGISDEVLNATQSTSLGLRLTRMLSDQLEGDYQFDNSEGTRFDLKFAV